MLDWFYIKTDRKKLFSAELGSAILINRSLNKKLIFRIIYISGVPIKISWCFTLLVSCVCVYFIPPWRLIPTGRCPRHAWEVRINDLVLWIFISVLLPSFFISISKSIIFHLQRRNSSPPKNWIENDMIYWNPAKRLFIWI